MVYSECCSSVPQTFPTFPEFLLFPDCASNVTRMFPDYSLNVPRVFLILNVPFVFPLHALVASNSFESSKAWHCIFAFVP